jgi:antitoxin component YwqK of YwqJK toxin-antitoxin module
MYKMLNNSDMIKAVFNNSKPKNGRWKEFNKHAVLISEGDYINDQKHGLWKEYFDTGELMIEEGYHYGVPHGRYITYHLNGKVLSHGQYIHGKREGYFKVYDESGLHVKSLSFDNNILVEEIHVIFSSIYGT